MDKSIPGIIYTMDKINPIIDSNNSMYRIPYRKNIEYFSNIEAYNEFIRDVEKEVRSSDRYKAYIKHLKEEVKLRRCQVLSELSDEDVSIEMHHGPIFNLFDYCSIILEYFLYKKYKISTFLIANHVLDEHFNNRVQVVMLSSTMHEAVHNRDIFINYNQGYGKLQEFIDKYGFVFLPEHIEKLNRYIDKSLLTDSTDNNLLSLNARLFNN